MAKYSVEFKQDAVALVRQGARQREVGRDFGVLKSVLSKWVADAGRGDAGLPATKDVTAGQVAPVRVPIVVACRVLGFSKQAYYQWVKEPVSKREAGDQHLIGVLRTLHAEAPKFGYWFLTDEMLGLGYIITQRCVWRLCRVAGIRTVITKCKGRAGRAGAAVGDDLVEREFTADGPNRLWLTDITQQWTNENRLYMCAVKDAWSNRIVGYWIGPPMQASPAVRGLENAVEQRDHPVGTVVHSNRGGQFRSQSFQGRLRRHQLQGSMGRVGAGGDNAAMESFDWR